MIVYIIDACAVIAFLRGENKGYLESLVGFEFKQGNRLCGTQHRQQNQ